MNLCVAIIDVPRNIGLKLGGAVATTEPEVVVESANACSGAAVVLIVFTLRKQPPT